MRITPEDIADRLWYRKRFWSSTPIITIIGEPGEFGIIHLNFFEYDRQGNPSEFPVAWRIFVHHKEDLANFHSAVMECIIHFDKYVEKMMGVQ